MFLVRLPISTFGGIVFVLVYIIEQNTELLPTSSTIVIDDKN